MTARNGNGFDALGPVSAALAYGFSARRAFALALVAVLATLGWAYLALMLAAMRPGEIAALGPGMGVIERLAAPLLGDLSRTFLAVLCRAPQAAPSSLADLALILSMWLAMTGAMMLPTAAPMITTYAEIADTAARAGRRVQSVAVLVGGYLAVWAGFALVAALAQAVAAGALFLLAGAYQFTAVKHACLTRCRSPFPVLFGRWSERRADLFSLGLEEGLNCLGCCWALMLLMFAVGVMNIVWMVVLAIVFVIERLTTGRVVPHGVGVALVLIGLSVWGGVLVERGLIRL